MQSGKAEEINSNLQLIIEAHIWSWMESGLQNCPYVLLVERRKQGGKTPETKETKEAKIRGTKKPRNHDIEESRNEDFKDPRNRGVKKSRFQRSKK